MKTFYGPAGSSFSDLFPSRSFSFSFELAKKIKKEKKGGGKEYIHRFPGLTANPPRKNPNVSNSPRNLRTKLLPTPTQFSFFLEIIFILGIVNLDSWFVKILVGG